MPDALDGQVKLLFLASLRLLKWAKSNLPKQTGNRKWKVGKSVRMLQNGDNDSISIRALSKLCAIEEEITMII